MGNTEVTPLLQTEHYAVSFRQYRSGFGRTDRTAVRDLCLTVREGELVALVGASGSGKSLLAHAILGILPYNALASGKLFYRGRELTPRSIQKLRGREIVLVPQSVAYLDPRMKVGAQLVNGERSIKKKQKAEELLERLHLKKEIQKLYPFELSGGMMRRVLIASAMLEEPRLIIADEPTPGLPKSVARQVAGHFRDMAKEGAGVLFITHDLELATWCADRIVVLYAGMTLEDAPASDFEEASLLRHPYSKALFRAMPKHGFSCIPGIRTDEAAAWDGCPFISWCAHACEKCQGEIALKKRGNGYVRCVLEEGEHCF